MGITNGAANIMSIIAPLVVGFVINDAVCLYFQFLIKFMCLFSINYLIIFPG